MLSAYGHWSQRSYAHHFVPFCSVWVCGHGMQLSFVVVAVGSHAARVCASVRPSFCLHVPANPYHSFANRSHSLVLVRVRVLVSASASRECYSDAGTCANGSSDGGLLRRRHRVSFQIRIRIRTPPFARVSERLWPSYCVQSSI